MGWMEGGTGKQLGFVIGKGLNKGGGGLIFSLIPFGHRMLITSHPSYPKRTTTLVPHFQSAAANNCWPTYSQSSGTYSHSKNFSRQKDCLVWVVWLTLSSWNTGKTCCSGPLPPWLCCESFSAGLYCYRLKPHSGQTAKLMSNNDQWCRQLLPAYKTSLNENQKEQAL